MELLHPRLRQAGALLVPLLVIILAQPGDLEARTWRVWKDGSGDYTSIQPAVDAAADGDTILIGPGRYTESSDYPYDGEEFHGETFVGIDKNDLTLMGVHRDSVVIGPMEQDFVGFLPKGIAMRLGVATGLTVRDLTVRNAREAVRLHQRAAVFNVVADSCEIGVIAGPSTLVLDSLIVRAASFEGVTVFGPGQLQVVNSLFEDNPGFGVAILDSTSAELQGCTFRRNTAGITVQRGSGARIAECSFLDNGFGEIDASGQSQVTITNSQVRGARNGITIQEASTLDASRLLFGPFGEEAVIAVGGARVSIANSDLRWTFTPAIRLGGYPTDWQTVEHDFRNNFWTTTDSQTIADAIYDGNDDPQVNSFVLFEPIRFESTPVESPSMGGLKARFRFPRPKN